jgi:hypothetical protein
MAFSDSYNSLYSNETILVPVKAATVFAAHESSLFLGGQLVPVVQAPNGLVKIPKLSGGTASNMGAGDAAIGDITAAAVTGASVDLVCDLYAARTVVRDLGAIDATEIGRQLGNKISAKFDADVANALGDLTAQEIASGNLDLEEIFAAVATIRGAGETGQLYGVVSTNAYAALMGAIGSTAYAGGDLFQGQALRSGFFGTIAGVQCFVSSYLNDTNTGVTGSKMAIFGQDALRIAMQKNVDVEVARRAEAVGNDVVASLHATVGVVDANRGVLIKDAS